MASDPRMLSDKERGEHVADKLFQRRYGKQLRNQPVTGRYNEPRSWLDRTGDEIAAWFGNRPAMRRRQWDEAVGDHSGEGPKSYIDSDARMVDDVSRRLTVDPKLNATNIEVLVLAGAVTLNGTVTTAADKRRAEELAVAAPGVNQVQNNLLVA